MGFIKERSNRTNTTRYYKLEEVNTVMSAIKWISDVRENDEIAIDYIYFSDLMNRSEEGSGNLQLEPLVSTNIMIKELQKREVDLISLNGKFAGKPIVIGIDLRDSTIYVTTRKKIPADVEAIERVFQLI